MYLSLYSQLKLTQTTLQVTDAVRASAATTKCNQQTPLHESTLHITTRPTACHTTCKSRGHTTCKSRGHTTCMSREHDSIAQFQCMTKTRAAEVCNVTRAGILQTVV